MPRSQTVTASPSPNPPELKKTHLCLSSVASDSVRPPPTVVPTGLLCAWRFPKASILDWVAMPSFRGSSRPRDRTQVFYHCREILYHWSHRGSRKRDTDCNVQCTCVYISCDVEATFHFCTLVLIQLPLLMGAKRMEFDVPVCLPFFFFSSWVYIQGTFDFSRSSVDGLGLGGFPGGRMWAGIQWAFGEGAADSPGSSVGRVRLHCSGNVASCKASGSSWSWGRGTPRPPPPGGW